MEIEVRCRQRPDPHTLTRVAGFAMRTILGVSNVEVIFEEGETDWTFHWGGAGHVIMFFTAPGEYGVDGPWYLNFNPGLRGRSVPELFMIVLAAVAALLSDGTLIDDNYPFQRADHTAEAMLAQVLRAAPLEVEPAIHLLVTGRLP
ncbi:hypothetical protein FXF51_07005 [Nonomuraea sp. PA05]|uniref:hypothetical protein n=1 Tax=Nonomuraea sp. PA05 TaxID=2604466 RepID=UPI0011D8A8BB|nr:hypothetical protein [Nonomuraea sp. PA05]TYB69896.1 hypothetical protein FXF51_07005 [Nonomuraea sp. PA05]